jgi:RNA ligase
MSSNLLEQLQSYEAKGLLRSQTHNTLPLRIYNYTEQCQEDGEWDEITLQARGLVVDLQGNVVARPFKSFEVY